MSLMHLRSHFLGRTKKCRGKDVENRNIESNKYAFKYTLIMYDCNVWILLGCARSVVKAKMINLDENYFRYFFFNTFCADIFSFGVFTANS